jgi:hypothetical protein
MVIIPDFVTVADGLTFTVGQITWTTGTARLHRHDYGGSTDPICADHIFTSNGSDHAGYGSDHSSNVSDHAGNSPPASSLPGAAV